MRSKENLQWRFFFAQKYIYSTHSSITLPVDGFSCHYIFLGKDFSMYIINLTNDLAFSDSLSLADSSAILFLFLLWILFFFFNCKRNCIRLRLEHHLNREDLGAQAFLPSWEKPLLLWSLIPIDPLQSVNLTMIVELQLWSLIPIYESLSLRTCSMLENWKSKKWLCKCTTRRSFTSSESKSKNLCLTEDLFRNPLESSSVYKYNL